jgi:hypothetical protein
MFQWLAHNSYVNLAGRKYGWTIYTAISFYLSLFALGDYLIKKQPPWIK